MDHFQMLRQELPKINSYVPQNAAEAFAIEEFKRFISVGGTILSSFKNVRTDFSERIITHILIRSLLENYFWLLYIFEGNVASAWLMRFDYYLDGFKREYSKLYNDQHLPHKAQLDAPDPSWALLPKLMDINSVLTQMVNNHGNKLNFLYFLYRITSFDTHGKSMASLFEAAFGKPCNFPYIKIEEGLDLIANQYLVIWQQISPP